MKNAPESPASRPPSPAGPAFTVRSVPRRVEDVIPSSDLVIQPEPSAPGGETPGTAVPEPLSPLTPAGAATATPPPAEPPPTAPVRPLFRRGVTPARLFLTREFSSVRIRSRQLTAPGSESAAVTAETHPPAAAAPTPDFAPEPSAEPPAPVPASAPDNEIPLASSFAEPPPAPETVVVPVAEVLPDVEAIPPAEPDAAAVVAAEAPVEPELPVTPEPGPIHLETAAPEPEFAPVPVVASLAPEPSAAHEPMPAAVPDDHPATTHAPFEPAPAAAAEEETHVVPTTASTHEPEPSDSRPAVVDITPEPVILPPPSDPGRPTYHPETAVTQPIAPFIRTSTMSTVQPVTGERATAQLTLSLEVSSLQLTPAFRLGSVQLRPLSNVVSLQLGAGVGPQPAANPLAANISFEILSVQTGGDGQIQSLVLKPLPQARADTAPQPRLQVDAVQLTRGVENAPIQITPAQATSTAVQLLTTYAIAGIDFTPNFEVGTMRLEPSTRTVLLRLNQPGGAELPPAFEIGNVEVGGDGQISLMHLTPTTL